MNGTVCYFNPLATFEGSVLEILENTFTARWLNINDIDEEYTGEILKSDINDTDSLKTIGPGSIFYWAITEEHSILYFPKFSPWTQEEIDSAKQALMRLRRYRLKN